MDYREMNLPEPPPPAIDGDLIFGGINGITIFNPKEIIKRCKKAYG